MLFRETKTVWLMFSSHTPLYRSWPHQVSTTPLYRSWPYQVISYMYCPSLPSWPHQVRSSTNHLYQSRPHQVSRQVPPLCLRVLATSGQYHPSLYRLGHIMSVRPLSVPLSRPYRAYPFDQTWPHQVFTTRFSTGICYSRLVSPLSA